MSKSPRSAARQTSGTQPVSSGVRVQTQQPPPQQQPPLPTEVLSYHDGYEAQNGTVVQYQPEWTKQHQLEGDGLLPLLYDHLWKSDRTREHRLREALIPDTVVFEHNFPRAWYTYDLKTMELVKRAGKLLDSQSIYKHFCLEERGCDIVAQFYHRSVSVKVDHHSLAAQQRGRRAGSPGRHRSGRSGSADGCHHHHHGAQAASSSHGEDKEELTTAVEFFTKETLFDFLHNRKVKPDGVLQKFLVPKGESSSRHNFQIQAVWSPLVTLVYKRTNKHRLNDKTTSSVHERAATFDGLAHYSSESLVAEGTKSRIDELCKTIVKHFFVTEHKQITRLVLHFKIDDQDRIWVLWASSLRIGSDKLNPSYLRVPMQLAMRVENVNGGSSREEIQQARRNMQKQLVERDVDLYNLTGDWAFASQCAQKFDTDSASAGASTSPRRGTGPKAAAIAAPAANESARATAPHYIPQPPPSSSLHGAAIVGFDDAMSTTTSMPRYRGLTTTGSVSQRSEAASQRDNLRMYVSPRAPFLPTYGRQHVTPIESESHPLHNAYVNTHASGEGSGDSAHGGGGVTGAAGHAPSGQRNRSQSSAVASTAKPRHTVRIRKTEPERVLEALNSLAQDILYTAYSLAMEGGTATAGGPGPARRCSISLAPEIMQCLTNDEVLLLAKELHLEPSAAVDNGDNETTAAADEHRAAACDAAGAPQILNVFEIPDGSIGRGRRQDRPVAQIAEDVRQFFVGLFANEATAQRIVSVWNSLHV